MARVLIIDDSPTVTRALATALGRDGHVVEELSQFSSLAERLTSFDPEVIVLDLEMPGFSGVQFARFISRISATPPPIILHSGSDRLLIKAAAKEIKPFEVVPKGTAPRELSKIVARAAARPDREPTGRTAASARTEDSVRRA